MTPFRLDIIEADLAASAQPCSRVNGVCPRCRALARLPQHLAALVAEARAVATSGASLATFAAETGRCRVCRRIVPGEGADNPCGPECAGFVLRAAAGTS